MRRSITLSYIEELTQPFHCQLLVYADGQTRQQPVSIRKTFNYLLGLHVETRRVYDDDGRRSVIYCGQMDHRSNAVIWRESKGWQDKAFEHDKDFVATPKLTEGAD